MLTIPASEVAEGDFLPGLGDAYVIESQPEEVTTFTAHSGYTALLGTFQVITFNDAQGDEGYLILPEDNPVEVQR